MMQTEVKAFEGRDVPCKVKIDEKNFLPEYSEEAGVESCLGGVLLHARKGKIVCSNTLDDRMQLCYQQAIPDIRRTLFPSFKKTK